MDILSVFELYPDQESCIAHLEYARWKGTPKCPYCTSTNTARLQHRHRCYECKTSFSVMVGTMFHHTHLPLQKWFLAISLMLNARKSLSALQLSRDIKVNKNTAWRIAMQIRKAMTQAEHRNLLMGLIEMDETYIGGKPRKGSGGPPAKRGRGTKKTPVVGAIERGGRVTAKVSHKSKLKGHHLRAFVKNRIKADDSALITDQYTAYRGMHRILPHAVINHSKWYVDGEIHTNSIEGFWALLKRGMFGQFHSVSRKHLQRYVDEFCYRFNLRGEDPGVAFYQTINRGMRVEV